MGEWWRRCVRQLVLAGQPLEHLARSVLSVEFHGYHSPSFAPIPITLPSQWFGFSLVEQAIARGATVVMTRGRREWEVAVPELMSYTPRRRPEAPDAGRNQPRQLWEPRLGDDPRGPRLRARVVRRL